MDTIKRRNLRNFDFLLGCRDVWFLALAHGWHVRDLVNGLGLSDLNGFLYFLDRADLSVCRYRHVHDLHLDFSTVCTHGCGTGAPITCSTTHVVVT